MLPPGYIISYNQDILKQERYKKSKQWWASNRQVMTEKKIMLYTTGVNSVRRLVCNKTAWIPTTTEDFFLYELNYCNLYNFIEWVKLSYYLDARESCEFVEPKEETHTERILPLQNTAGGWAGRRKWTENIQASFCIHMIMCGWKIKSLRSYK